MRGFRKSTGFAEALLFVRDLVCGSVLGGREFHGIRVFLPHAPHVGFTLLVSHDALEIGIAIGFGDLADQLAGITRGDVPGGNVFGDDASRADHDVIADVDTGQDDRVSADPDVIADRDVDSILIGRVARSGMNRVTCRIDGDARGDLTVVADHYFAHVDDGAVVVAEEILPDFNVETVVAVEGRIDKSTFRLAEQLLNDSADALEIGAVHCVEFLCEAAGAFLLLKD